MSSEGTEKTEWTSVDWVITTVFIAYSLLCASLIGRIRKRPRQWFEAGDRPRPPLFNLFVIKWANIIMVLLVAVAAIWIVRIGIHIDIVGDKHYFLDVSDDLSNELLWDFIIIFHFLTVFISIFWLQILLRKNYPWAIATTAIHAAFAIVTMGMIWGLKDTDGSILWEPGLMCV